MKFEIANSATIVIMLALLWMPYSITHANSTSISLQSPSSLFEYVDTLPGLESKLQKAKSSHKPVMIEFFATWCPICKRVDQEVLSDIAVQKSMRVFDTIRIDVSEGTRDTAVIMKKYHVYAVPTVIFYDKQGSLVNGDKVRHGVNKQKLLATLHGLA